MKKSDIDKELEIIKAEIVNSGKPTEIVEKISKGKITKFINDNTLLNQVWIGPAAAKMLFLPNPLYIELLNSHLESMSSSCSSGQIDIH